MFVRVVLLLAAISLVPAGDRDLPTGGRVRADRGVLVDDRGPFLAMGASLFWALWGERHDPDRLDRNLVWLAQREFNYVRMFAMVGSETWRDRAIDPGAADYWTIVDRLFAAAELRLGGKDHKQRVRIVRAEPR